MHIGEIIPFGECGFLARIAGARDSASSAARANAIAARLLADQRWRDVTPGLDSIAARYDPLRFAPQSAHAAFTKAVTAGPFTLTKTPRIKIELPVFYGPKAGPDFQSVCELTGLSPEALIERHVAGRYRVLIMGFAPGFAYMGPLEGSLQTPRLETPRQTAPAGSVGLAGPYTGVYSLKSPGGWRLIGRTPLPLFRPENASPFFFSAGAHVRFRPITEDEFNKIAQGQPQ